MPSSRVPALLISSAIGLALVSCATTADAAAMPAAHLRFAFVVPSRSATYTGASSVRYGVHKHIETDCRVADSGPAAVPHLHIRVAFFSTTPKRWRVGPHRTGLKVPQGFVEDVGTLRPGHSTTVHLVVKARVADAAQLSVTCQADPSRTVRIVQPRIDRAGDHGVALRISPAHS